MDNTFLLQSRRTEYLKKLQKVTTPLFIEGVYSIYYTVKKNNKSKRFLLKEFQDSMVDVSRWSQDIIKNEHLRFKKQSSVLDKLIKAIFDLDIILKKDLCKNANDFIPQPWDFLHQCYLNIARALWKQPFLIYDVNVDKLTIQQNKLKIEKIVSLCIQDTFTQYIPLDIEHDDVSNIDYFNQTSNQELVPIKINKNNDDVNDEVNSQDDNDINEVHSEHNEGFTEYGDNNDDMRDTHNNNVTNCNDNFKKLDYEINNNLHEGLNVFESDNNSFLEQNTYDVEKQVVQQETDKDVDNYELDEIKESVEEVENSDEHFDTYNDNTSSDEEDNNNTYDDDTTSDKDGYQDYIETKSFHSEDVGDVDSVKSDELFVSRKQDPEMNVENIDLGLEPQTHAELHQEVQQHEFEEQKIIDPEKIYNELSTQSKFDISIDSNTNNKNEIREVFIGGGKDDRFGISDENDISVNVPDVKVINVDDSKIKSLSKKDALLNIKKKVKSSIHNRDREHRYERYGDKVRVERKNMSFF